MKIERAPFFFHLSFFTLLKPAALEDTVEGRAADAELRLYKPAQYDLVRNSKSRVVVVNLDNAVVSLFCILGHTYVVKCDAEKHIKSGTKLFHYLSAALLRHEIC